MGNMGDTVLPEGYRHNGAVEVPGGQLGPVVRWCVACLELAWVLLLDKLPSRRISLTLSNSRMPEMTTSSFSA